MNPDPFYFTITIDQPAGLLLALMVLCLLGTIITAWAMKIVSGFFLDKKNKKFFITQFQFPWSYEKFKMMVDDIPDHRKDAVRMQLRIDYYFMPFAYGLLFFAGCYVLWFTSKQLSNSVNHYTYLLWVPFLAWLFDIIENKLISSSLNQTSRTKTLLLLSVSLAKWILAVSFYLLAVVVYIIIRLNV